MRIAFDPAKSRRNERARGLPFDQVRELDWDSLTFVEDTRRSYPEPRFVGFGYIAGRLHFLCFTPIDGGVRIISFRKANKREVKRHEEENE